MEHFNRLFVAHINLLKDDGYTPLHLAALNDHLDVVTAFAEVVGGMSMINIILSER